MTGRLSLWGVGPNIVLAAAAYAAVAGWATWLWPEGCRIAWIPGWILTVLGGVFLGIGVPFLVVSARAASRAYRRDELATTGIFGLVRNPIYSAWIVGILPGLALWSGSWPMLLMPLVAYLVFKVRIRREEEYLERRFGESYRRYRAGVNELIPLPRRRAS